VLLPWAIASPDFSGLFYVAAIECAVGATLVLAVVITGVALARGRRRRAVMLSAASACLVVALWRGPFGGFWFSGDLIVISMWMTLVAATALAACLLYPIVLAVLALFSQAPPRARMGAGALVAGVLLLGIRAAMLPLHFGLARLTKSPREFRAAFAEYQRDAAVINWITWPLMLPDIPQAIAENPAAPPDVLVALVRSPRYHAETVALRNPAFPAAHVMDADILRSQSGRMTIAGDSRLIGLLPADTLDALARQYADVRLALAVRANYLPTVPRSTLLILSADTSGYIRELATRALAARH
jgi:hypothetical protein